VKILRRVLFFIEGGEVVVRKGLVPEAPAKKLVAFFLSRPFAVAFFRVAYFYFRVYFFGNPDLARRRLEFSNFDLK
jgi:hypothetical protein